MKKGNLRTGKNNMLKTNVRSEEALQGHIAWVCCCCFGVGAGNFLQGTQLMVGYGKRKRNGSAVLVFWPCPTGQGFLSPRRALPGKSESVRVLDSNNRCRMDRAD